MRRMLVLGLLAALVTGALAESASAVVPAKTYKSKDGVFKVFVPRGALVKNVKVTIVARSKSSLPAKLRPETFGRKIYEVKPHGLRFRKPVTVTWVIKKTGGFDASEGIPAVILISRSPRGKWDLLRNRSTMLVGNTLVAKATTRHFSTIVAANGGVTAALTPESVRKMKGESWTANVVLSGPWQANAGMGWAAEPVVTFEGELPSTDPSSRSASFKCAGEGSGTFSFFISVAIAREKPNIASVFLLHPEWIEAGTDLGSVGASGKAVCDPAPAASACAEPPKAAPTTHNGESKVQVTGQCAGLLASGLDHTRVDAPSGSQITEYNAHSTSCTFEGAGVAVTCKIKPDGRICMILKFTPPLAAGSVVRVRLGKADGTILVDQNLTVGANGEASCSTGP